MGNFLLHSTGFALVSLGSLLGFLGLLGFRRDPAVGQTPQQHYTAAMVTIAVAVVVYAFGVILTGI